MLHAIIPASNYIHHRPQRRKQLVVKHDRVAWCPRWCRLLRRHRARSPLRSCDAHHQLGPPDRCPAYRAVTSVYRRPAQCHHARRCPIRFLAPSRVSARARSRHCLRLLVVVAPRPPLSPGRPRLAPRPCPAAAVPRRRSRSQCPWRRLACMATPVWPHHPAAACEPAPPAQPDYWRSRSLRSCDICACPPAVAMRSAPEAADDDTTSIRPMLLPVLLPHEGVGCAGDRTADGPPGQRPRAAPRGAGLSTSGTGPCCHDAAERPNSRRWAASRGTERTSALLRMRKYEVLGVTAASDTRLVHSSRSSTNHGGAR